MIQHISMAIIGFREVSSIYSLQEIVSLTILFLILIFIFINNKYIKLVLTILATITIVLHYIVLAMLAFYENILLIPLFVIEHNTSGTALSLDLGQILILLLFIAWRHKIIAWIKNMQQRQGHLSRK
ncbi:MAG: hypothetical protein J7K21_07280 [Desulfurococcales archaeon]|nr:hypothetical protein [Desulfurococcales archaeon]